MQMKLRLKKNLIETVSEIISILQDKGHNLTTDNIFENLTKKQSKFENARDRLLSNRYSFAE